MITDESTIRITAMFCDQRKHRYLLRRVWDKSKPSATVIMSNSSTADITKGDLTGLLIQNNLSALGYGSASFVNLFSFMCQKIDLSKDVNIAELTNADNEKQILQSVQDTDICVVAIGSLTSTYKRAAAYQSRLFDLLRKFQNKVHVIAAPDGSEGLHPLSAKLRAHGSWALVPYKLPNPLPADKKDSHANTGKQSTHNKKITNPH